MRTAARAPLNAPANPLYNALVSLFYTAVCALIGWPGNLSPEPVSSAPDLKPAWTWQTSAAIEWTSLVGHETTTGLLVATRDGHLHLLDAACGRPRWPSPPRVPSGVRPAQHGGAAPAETAYAYDPATIYALSLKTPRALRWRFGDGSADAQSYPSDPEVLAQWIAVAAARDAVLAVGTDGRTVCLSPEDGTPRWTFNLKPLSLARLRVGGERAAIVWKAAGRVRATLVTTADATPNPRTVDLGDAWPVWTEWTPAGLTSVAGGRVTVVPVSGPQRTFDTGLRWVNGAAVDVFRPEASAEAPESTLLLIGHGPHVSAYDLTTGDRAWASWQLPDSPASGGNVGRLDVVGACVLCCTANEVTVSDARHGSLKTIFRTPAPILWAGWADRRAQVLYSAEADAGKRNLAPPDHTLGIMRAAQRKPDSTTWSVCRIAGAQGRPQVVWLRKSIVLIEPTELRAYRLP